MYNFTNLKPRTRKKFTFVITTLLVLIGSLLLSVPAGAWVSDWVIWEYPQPVTYSKDSSSSSNTKAAWDYSVASWNNAQSKVDLDTAIGSTDVYLSHTDNEGVSWDGICYKWDYDSDDYLDYALAQLNQHYTEDYTPTNKRRSVSGHELGHALGLLEGNYDDSLMEQDTSVRWGTYGIYTPQQDDINGINTLYYEW